MAKYLTKRQYEILSFLEKFIGEKGYSPSLEEIGQGLGLSSLATVHVHLRNLEEKNMIRRNWNHSRSIEVINKNGSNGNGNGSRNTVELPLLGRVAAGIPIEAIEMQESVEVPQELLRGKETFALKVQGDSMIDEHIRSGDIIIVERAATAENGETVVALVHGREATVKKFYREKEGMIRLQPANERMSPIFVSGEHCAVQGVVVGLLRRY
jgi:repressor LexA